MTSRTDQTAIRDRTLHALRQEGYRGFGDVTVISDGAEILKRLPRAMPKPTTHIIDWFHIAMKIQPMQQIADHMARSRSVPFKALPAIDKDIRAVKWRLWHGRVDRAIRDLEQLLARLQASQGDGELSVARLYSLSSQLLTYISSNRGSIVNYGIALPSRSSRSNNPRRVSGELACRQADGEEAADVLVPPRRSHAHAGPGSGDQWRTSRSTACTVPTAGA